MATRPRTVGAIIDHGQRSDRTGRDARGRRLCGAREVTEIANHAVGSLVPSPNPTKQNGTVSQFLVYYLSVCAWPSIIRGPTATKTKINTLSQVSILVVGLVYTLASRTHTENRHNDT